jgi:hypothetical protein
LNAVVAENYELQSTGKELIADAIQGAIPEFFPELT